MFKKALILAGGEGIRMKPLTNTLPKALIPINETNLIGQVISFLKNNDINEIYITYNYLPDVLFNAMKHNVDGFINTSNHDNSYFLFNTIIKDLNEPIIVIPCDILIDIDLQKLYYDYIELGSPAIMMVGVEPKAEIDGDYIDFDENQNIIDLNRTETKKNYASGLQIINPSLTNKLISPSDNFSEVWGKLIKNNNIKLSTLTPIKWCAYDSINNLKTYETYSKSN